MKTIPCHLPLLLAAALALAPIHAARADDGGSQIAFSDPSKPGTLKIRVLHGDVTVHGEDVKDIQVKSESSAESPTPRKDGMRVLSATSGYVLTEKNNVVTLEYGADGWPGGSSDFDITVPRSTSIIVSNSLHGDFDCTGVSGDIDAKTMSGDVALDDISGGALVETMNGEIKVNVKSLAESRPLSFTSMHGEITIHLPRDSKANIRFRTHRGVILTNFDEKALVTKTEISHGREGSRTHSRTAAPVAPTASAAPAAPSAPASESEASSDDDWHAQVRDEVRGAIDEAAAATRDALAAVHEGLAEANIDMSGAVPPMTGGKVVTGTLNGGGVEIQAATMTGDIVLKKGN